MILPKFKNDEKGEYMWAVKVTAAGLPTPAVLRRMEKVKLDLDSHASRSEFGYAYLDFIED